MTKVSVKLYTADKLKNWVRARQGNLYKELELTGNISGREINYQPTIQLSSNHTYTSSLSRHVGLHMTSEKHDVFRLSKHLKKL